MGFTLLEVMIALFICALVLSVLYSAYTGTFRNKDWAEAQADISMGARIALERIVEDLESAYLPMRGDKQGEGEEREERPSFVGEKGEVEGRRADSLHFLSRAHLAFFEEERPLGLARIGYRVRKEGDRESLALYRSDRSPLHEEEGEAGVLVCEGLRSVRFTYYDDRGEEYEVWDSTSEDKKGRLPARVAVALEFFHPMDPDKVLSFSTSVSIPLGREWSREPAS